MSENENKKLNVNDNYCSILSAPFLSQKNCESIINHLVPDLWSQSELADGTINKEKRNAVKQLLPVSEKGWPLLDVISAAKQINDNRYKFDISGILETDGPVVMKYDVGGHYDWHIDVGKKVANRKLSFIIQLSDPTTYEGGDIEIMDAKIKTEVLRAQGNITFFPSFIPHKITKVTKGERLSIVGWIHGSTFI